MRALVLGGAGAVAKETTRDLSHYSDFEEIVIAEYNVEAGEALAAELNDPRVKVIFFDANDEEGMRQLFPQFDVVVNGLPYKYDYIVNKVCVDVGVNGLDLSSDDPQFALHEEAKKKGMIFVPGVGATPGTTNMMVRRAAELLDRIESVDIYFAAFRSLAPSPGLLQTTLWEFNPEGEDRKEVYYEDGKWHPAPPLSGEKVVRFHDLIGEQKVYYVPHDEANTLPHSYPELRRAAVRGCFPPHVMDLMGALMRAGMLTTTPVRIQGQEMAAIDAVRDILWHLPICKENPVWAYGLVVEVLGERNGRRVKCTYRNQHPPQEEWGGESAYFKNVGIPLSIGAQLIAHGQTLGVGVLPPEQAFPAEPFFAELARRGIIVHEEIVEVGTIA
ncbi:MAG: hypothetical protein GXO55_09960 [Chloroflexi bacterium]|nr:hypothetical protein [Chloroflexota bacterium]